MDLTRRLSMAQVAARVAISPGPEISLTRQLSAPPYMANCFVIAPELLHQPRQRHVGIWRWLKRHTGLQIALRFATQCLSHAQLTQCRQQHGIACVLPQPTFGTLDLRQR